MPTGRRRTILLLLAAAVPPVLVFAALQTALNLKEERVRVERSTLQQARAVTELADARIAAETSAARILAGAIGRLPDPRQDYAAARQVSAMQPAWRNVILTDAGTGREIFDLKAPLDGAGRPARIDIVKAQGATAQMGALAGDRAACPCLYIHEPVKRNGRVAALLSIAVDPAPFQSLLVSRTPSRAVAALVDRNGIFVARSLNPEQRVGRLSSTYVRKAIGSGAPEGVYEGVTLEGFRSYTAFARSGASGLSTHIAIEKSLLDSPRRLTVASTALAGLATLGLAGFMVFLVARDIDRSRARDERMRHARKMEALGRLTGGVAHDFNNLLTAVIGGVDMALKTADDARRRRLMEGALEAARRGAKLTRQLLSFSRDEPIESADIDLSALFKGMRPLIEHTVGPSVRLEIDVDPLARLIRSDPDQLELALLNLAANARDAMPEGGVLTLRTAPSADADLMVDLLVSDTGQGMSPDVLERATEPFFTTKPMGRGTGLGLSQVFGLARQSGGSLQIQSEPGKGAQILLRLPRGRQEPETSQATAPAAPAAVATARRAVLVDDDPQVRVIAAAALRAAGWTVREACGPEEALRELRRLRPDLLVADYAMPGMTGAELAGAARGLAPGLPVLIISGYADLEAVEQAVGPNALLRKPFTPEDLAAAAAAALERDAAA